MRIILTENEHHEWLRLPETEKYIAALCRRSDTGKSRFTLRGSIMTHNEKVQANLSEGLKAARAAGIPASAEDAYCAAYLARELAELQEAEAWRREVEKFKFIATNPEQLRQWIHANKDIAAYVYDDIDLGEIAELVHNPESLGAYITMCLEAVMNYQVSEDEPIDREPEHDMRQRVRDYKVEELGVW
jgi:hypothetical protein